MPCPYFSSSDGDNGSASNAPSGGAPNPPTGAGSGGPNPPTGGDSASGPSGGATSSSSTRGDAPVGPDRNAPITQIEGAASGEPDGAAPSPPSPAPNEAALPADVPLHYRNYLGLDALLGLQNRLTGEGEGAAHDEHLFIVVHQVFELWFKQVVFELDSVRAGLLNRDQLSICCRRLARVVLLFKHVLCQFEILETMTALDFREFRDHLFPASGFQSHQFRLIENKLGLRPDDRVPYNQENYRLVFAGHEDVLRAFDRSELKEDTLFDVTKRWLEKIFLDGDEGEEFWHDYCRAVDILVANKKTEADRIQAREVFDSVILANRHQECLKRGDRRLSHTALQGALLVFMRRDHPSHSEQFSVLTLLQDIDALMARWRFLHMTTVQRMIGTSTAGTSGSVGYYYLRLTLDDRYKVFLDISNVSCFLLPRPLLEEAKRAQEPAEGHQQLMDRRPAGDDQQEGDHQQAGDHQHPGDHQQAGDHQ